MGTEKNKSGKGLGHYMEIGDNDKSSVAREYSAILEERKKTYGEPGNLKSVYERADNFLRRYKGIGYEDFIERSQLEISLDRIYGNLQFQERRGRYERDVAIGLSALVDLEEKGYDVEEILESLIEGRLPEEEIVYNSLANLIVKRPEDYLIQLLDISEKLARGEETPFKLRERLREVNKMFPKISEVYTLQRLDLEDRLNLREEEKMR